MERFYSETVNTLTLLIFLKLILEKNITLGRSEDQESDENSDDAEEEATQESDTSNDSEEESLTRGDVDPARTRVVDPARTRLVDPARTR